MADRDTATGEQLTPPESSPEPGATDTNIPVPTAPPADQASAQQSWREWVAESFAFLNQGVSNEVPWKLRYFAYCLEILGCISLLEEALFMEYNEQNVDGSLGFIANTLPFLSFLPRAIPTIAWTGALLGMLGDMSVLSPGIQARSFCGIDERGQLKAKPEAEVETDATDPTGVTNAQNNRPTSPADVVAAGLPDLAGGARWATEILVGRVLTLIGMMYGGAAQSLAIGLKTPEEKIPICVGTTATGATYYAIWSWKDVSAIVRLLINDPCSTAAPHLFNNLSMSTALHAGIDFLVMLFYRTIAWSFIGYTFAAFAGLTGTAAVFSQVLAGAGGAAFALSRAKYFEQFLAPYSMTADEAPLGLGVGQKTYTSMRKGEVRYSPDKITNESRDQAWARMTTREKLMMILQPALHGLFRASGPVWFAYSAIRQFENDTIEMSPGALAVAAIIGLGIFSWTFHEASKHALNVLIDEGAAEPKTGKKQLAYAWMMATNIPNQFCRAVSLPLFLHTAFPEMDSVDTVVLGLWIGWSYALVNFEYFRDIADGIQLMGKTLQSQARMVKSLVWDLPKGLLFDLPAAAVSACCKPSAREDADATTGEPTERTHLLADTGSDHSSDAGNLQDVALQDVAAGDGDGEHAAPLAKPSRSWCSFLPRSMQQCFGVAPPPSAYGRISPVVASEA